MLGRVPRQAFRMLMFLSSYAPLFALLAYANRSSTTVWVVLAVVIAVSLAGLVAVFRTLRATGPVIKVKRAVPKDGDVLAYIATYLVPFLNVDLSKSDGAVVFGGFLLVLAIVYVNSSMLFVNPVLSIARYHTFEVTDENDFQYSVITRRRDIDVDATIAPAQVSRYLRVEV
jgi:hypothetical protein